MKKSMDNAGDMLVKRVEQLIIEARQKVAVAVNTTMVYTYYEIGRMIVENEQNGQERAEYGKAVLKKLSAHLTIKFGKGFSQRNLEQMRQFFLIYEKKRINSADTVCAFSLSWSHYLFLMRIDNPDERTFYEIEATNERWSLRELKRQFDSSLYERLALSRNSSEIKALAKEGQIIASPKDIVKDPYVLEFLGLPELPDYSETEMEREIIEKIESFLLELGKGFTFAGRQVRITFDEKHFFVDLVFYNRVLQCFVLIDLKMGELTHQDLGQMQMYVHYYDRYVRLQHENKTIGIVLCRKKDDALVEITLPEDNTQIFASKYQTVMPSKEELKRIIQE